MALPSFYNQGDQEIYESGDKFIPQEQYRLNYTPSTSLASTVGNTGGVTGTQAAYPYLYPPQGGGGGIGGGNVFNYGTAVNPVAYGAYGEPGYSGGLPGDVQQTGWGRQDDEEGGAYLRPRKQIPGLASMAMSFIPGGNFLRRTIEKRMNPEYDPNKNLSGYAVAGLDDSQKGVYNALAAEGLLFQGSSGLKTATGKNYGAKGYFEGQQGILDKTIDRFGSIQNAKDYFAANPKTTNFLQTQLKEALLATGKLEEQEEYDRTVALRQRQETINKIKAKGIYDKDYRPPVGGGATDQLGGGYTPGDNTINWDPTITETTDFHPSQGNQGGQTTQGTDTPSGHAGGWGPGAKARGGLIGYFDGGIVRLL